MSLENLTSGVGDQVKLKPAVHRLASLKFGYNMYRYCTIWEANNKKVNRKIQGMPQSQAAAKS